MVPVVVTRGAHPYQDPTRDLLGQLPSTSALVPHKAASVCRLRVNGREGSCLGKVSGSGRGPLGGALCVIVLSHMGLVLVIADSFESLRSAHWPVT